MAAALEIRDLVIEFGKPPSAVRALDGVTLSVEQGTILGIVGESGSGKSTLGFAAGRLMPEDVRPAAGELRVLGQEVWSLSHAELRALRRAELRYVFQDPIAALDPTMKVGTQLARAFDPALTPEAVRAALEAVGLPDPLRIAAAWPHQLSGGMAQRVVIAMALIGTPSVIIADEATSALDASLRMHILELLRDRSRERGVTLVLLSHDLWAVRAFCDRIAVMYGGRVVEEGPTEAVFTDPAHPYTRALLAATPGRERPGETLCTIPGMPPVLRGESPGCAFAPRCAHAEAGRCDSVRPRIESRAEGWHLLCHRWREIMIGTREHGAA